MAERSRRVTSVDVAAEVGVSQATVARTFSSPHLVSSSTRQKVEAAAERIGYVPNAIARSLKSQRTNIVGAVVPAYGEYWQSVLTAFSRQLAERDRQLLLFSFTEPEQVESVLTSVQQYRLDGLVLASATIGQPLLAQMARSDRPLVAFNQPAASGLINSVSVNNEAGMTDIAVHLANLGCASILYIGGIATTSTDQLRYQGAARALGQRGIACPYLEAGSFSYDGGYKIAGSVVESDVLPDAIMVASDEVALGLLDGLKKAGVSVPGEVLVTGFDGLPQSSWAGYDLTTLVQPTEVLVERAIDLLLDPPTGGKPAELVVEGSIRQGLTTTRTDDHPFMPSA